MWRGCFCWMWNWTMDLGMWIFGTLVTLGHVETWALLFPEIGKGRGKQHSRQHLYWILCFDHPCPTVWMMCVCCTIIFGLYAVLWRMGGLKMNPVHMVRLALVPSQLNTSLCMHERDDQTMVHPDRGDGCMTLSAVGRNAPAGRKYHIQGGLPITYWFNDSLGYCFAYMFL